MSRSILARGSPSFGDLDWRMMRMWIWNRQLGFRVFFEWENRESLGYIRKQETEGLTVNSLYYQTFMGRESVFSSGLRS
jgi:hypothetical protein